MSLGRMAVAATTFACMTLLSVGWSGERGVSLSVASAQAAPKHAQASRHMAAGSHRYHRHYVRRGYGPNPVAAGADIAAGAVNTAGALALGAIGTAGAIAAAPFGGPYYGDGYYSPGTWGDYDCRPGYPGCRPYREKDWGYHH